jgi:hypothetical protein
MQKRTKQYSAIELPIVIIVPLQALSELKDLAVYSSGDKIRNPWGLRSRYMSYLHRLEVIEDIWGAGTE